MPAPAPSPAEFDVVIVGASYGGAHTASGLRQAGFGGSILMIGDEPHAPYERPPLSKAFFKGDLELDRLWLRNEAFWATQRIERLPSRRVERVQAATRTLTLGDGLRIRYGKLIWAAGARAKTLAGGRKVHTLRNLDDALDIRQALAIATEQPARLVIIGAGYIGLELAAAARSLGYSVTVVESQARVLARVTSTPVSDFYQALHVGRGVDLYVGQTWPAVTATGVQLPDGTELAADVVAAGIGVIPNVEPLSAAGIACSGEVGGVHVDAHCQTSDPDILALGDCAAHLNPFAGTANAIRLESVQNALDQAKVVVATLTGNPAAYNSLPWFWSDQYDTKLQTAGLAMAYDDIRLRGGVPGEALSVGYWRGERLVALDSVNRPADFMAGKMLITRQIAVDKARFSDPDIALKSLLA